jgi:dTDP-4-dehydrorhamnose reductase
VNEQRIFLDLSEDVTRCPLPSSSIGTAVLCAAVTSQEKCRLEPEYSRRVNVEGTTALAKRLVDSGVFVIFPSTNLVFDGEKPFAKANAPLNPQTEYGRQKAEAESQLLKLGDLVSIVRFSKVLSPNMTLFQNWIRDLKTGKEIHPFFDMVMSPVSLSFAVDVLLKVEEKKVPGIMQVSASKDISYAEAALYIARKLSLDEKLIKPVSYRESGIVYAPLHTTLDINLLSSELKMIPPDVYETVENSLNP